MQRASVWRQRRDFSLNPHNFEEKPWATCTAAKMPEPNCRRDKNNKKNCIVIKRHYTAGSDTEVMNIKLKCSELGPSGVIPASWRQDNCLSVITGLELIKWNGMGY